MAKPRPSYFGTDTPDPSFMPPLRGPQGPAAGFPPRMRGLPSQEMTDPGVLYENPADAEYSSGMENSFEREPRMGDGGGADPRVPIEGEEPSDAGVGPNPADPYGAAGGEGYADGLGAGPIDIDSAHRELGSWVQQQTGLTEEQVGDMTLKEIQALVDQHAPKDPLLREALGTVQADMGMVPDDPAMGPGPMPRYVPGGR